MQAYLNKKTVKTKLIEQLQAHYDADEIVKGKYWEGGKGCAVGCTLHNSNHVEYETKLGIPEMLARLEDTIFEGLPNDKAKLWPIRFSKAIAVGADLSLVGYQFMYWNLTENLVLKDSDDKEVQAAIVQCRAAIQQCAEAIRPLTKGQFFDESAARSAARSAESAASAARSAESAAWSAARSAARSAAESAAWSAAGSAAESAAWGAARSAASAARSAAYEKMADKLIELIESAA